MIIELNIYGQFIGEIPSGARECDGAGAPLIDSGSRLADMVISVLFAGGSLISTSTELGLPLL